MTEQLKAAMTTDSKGRRKQGAWGGGGGVSGSPAFTATPKYPFLVNS